MRTFTVSASADTPEDAVSALLEVLAGIATINYTEGFPTTGTWLRRARHRGVFGVRVEGGQR